MEPPIRPRIDRWRDMPDPRHPRGRRHPLAAMLALMGVARRCGDRSYSAMADWGRCDGQQLARALGFTHDTTPWAATFYHVLRQLDRHLVEATLGAWAERLLTAMPPAPDEPEAMAIDGNTLRGRRQQGAPAVHRLSVLHQRLGLPLWPQAVADKTQEIPVREDVWRELVVEGRVITVDAWLRPRAVAARLVHGGGDDVMLVKGNPPPLHQDIHRVFHEAHALAEPLAAAQTVDSGHGRIEQRRVTLKKGGEPRYDVVYGVTSLGPDQASPERLLHLVRPPWHLEHNVPWVRDVTCDEDRSQVRCGSMPQVMAAFRTTAIGLRRWAVEVKIAAACRRVAAQPWAALTLIGIIPEN